MFGPRDQKLKYEITADATKAHRAISGLHGDVKGLGSGLATSFGGALPAIGLAAGAIAGVSIVAIRAGSALFDLAQTSAEYGTKIYDAGTKTGLTAKTLSALDYAAKQTGQDFNAVVDTVAKFNVVLGSAATGNEKAQATLAKYNITATDTTEALSQAIKAIGEMDNATLQAAAAKDLFKDRTGEVLKIVNQFKGDLPGLISRLEKMGVTLSDHDAKAAKEFTDTLTDLQMQAGAVGRQFVQDLMPMMTDAMKGISKAMADNQQAVREWGETFALIVKGAVQSAPYMSNVVSTSFDAMMTPVKALTLGLIDLGDAWNVATLGLHGYVMAQRRIVNEAFDNRPLRGFAGGSVNIGGSALDLAAGRGGRKSRAPKDDSARLAREAEQRRRDEVRSAEQTMNYTLQVYRAGSNERIAILDATLARGEIVELQHIRDVSRVRQEAIQDEMRLNQELLNNRQITLNEEERAEILQKIKVLTIELRTERQKGATDIVKQTKAELDAANKILEAEKKKLDALKKHRQQKALEFSKWKRDEKERQEIEDRRKARERAERLSVMGGGGLGGGIGGGLGVNLPSIYDENDKILSQVDFMKAVYGDIADFAGNAIGGMIQGLADLGAQWLVTGEFSAQAALKMLASAAFGIATQAAFKGIFELAEAAAAAARYDFYAASMHKAAAKMYFKTAIVAGAFGVAAGLAGRAVGGGDSGGGGGRGPNAPGGPSRDSAELNPYSRASETAFDSGRRGGIFGEQLREVIQRLADRIDSVSPGNILVAGSREKHGFIGNQAVSDMKSNAGTGRALASAIGIK